MVVLRVVTTDSYQVATVVVKGGSGTGELQELRRVDCRSSRVGNAIVLLEACTEAYDVIKLEIDGASRCLPGLAAWPLVLRRLTIPLAHLREMGRYGYARNGERLERNMWRR